MALRPNNHRPGEVSLTACPFDECGEKIAESDSFARHWPDCAANPENGGMGGFPSDRQAQPVGGD